MQGSRTHRTWPWCLLSLLLVTAGACQIPGSQPTGGTSSTSASEADRTRKMEEKQREIERKAEEIRTMQGTDQEKIDAMNELDRMQRELADMQDDTP